MTRVYIATPYSHPDASVRHRRFEAVNEFAAKMMEQGYTIFSPISQSHPIADHLGPETENWDFWQKQDLPWLELCDAVYVLTLNGWADSVGVTGEIAHAAKLNIPVLYITPEDQGIDNVSR
ncbi:MAG: DUF1937 family protein [bacterium]|nr:DUF1937 family protein [bacterium]